MMFRKEHGKVNVTSLVERVSRYGVVMRNEDRHSKPIMDSLINGPERHGRKHQQQADKIPPEINRTVAHCA